MLLHLIGTAESNDCGGFIWLLSQPMPKVVVKVTTVFGDYWDRDSMRSKLRLTKDDVIWITLLKERLDAGRFCSYICPIRWSWWAPKRKFKQCSPSTDNELCAEFSHIGRRMTFRSHWSQQMTEVNTNASAFDEHHHSYDNFLLSNLFPYHIKGPEIHESSSKTSGISKCRGRIQLLKVD